MTSFDLSWHTLPPSFRLCRYVVWERLPARRRLWLSPREKTLLTWLLYLAWVRVGKGSRRSTFKCSPSRQYLAEKLQASTRSISRWTEKLCDLGLLGKGHAPFTGATPNGVRWWGHAEYFPRGLLIALLRKSICDDGLPGYQAGPAQRAESRGKRKRRPDPLTAEWGHFCQARGLDPDRTRAAMETDGKKQRSPISGILTP